MNRKCIIAIAFFLAVPLNALADAGDASNVMTLRQCLDVAVANSQKVETAAADAEVREYQHKSMRGRFLPVVKLDGKVIGFNDKSDLKVDLSFLGTLMKDFEIFLTDEVKAQLATYQKDGLKIRVRDDLVYEGGVTVAQPIGQMFTIVSGERALKALADAAAQEGVSVRRRVELDVVRAYSGLVAAKTMERTIETALVQLESMERQVEAYMQAELVERNALLKVKVARTEYEKNLFAARKAARLAAGALNLLMNRPLDTPIEPVSTGLEDETLSSAIAAADLAGMQDQAINARPELQAARTQKKAAEWGKRAAVGKMLPDINAVFRYHNTQGTGQMQPENELFGGLVATWDVWNWGVDYYSYKAADATARKAAAQIAEAEDMVRLEVQSKLLDLQEAEKTVELVGRQVDLAEENLRIERLRFEAGESTTTELLEAQTMQIKAVNDMAVARVNLDSARMALAVARGIDLL